MNNTFDGKFSVIFSIIILLLLTNYALGIEIISPLLTYD